MPDFKLINNKFSLVSDAKEIPLSVFGSHNLMNIEGAALVCQELGIKKDDFFHAISDFRGAGKRLEVMLENDKFIAFRDFAHAPRLQHCHDVLSFAAWSNFPLGS